MWLVASAVTVGVGVLATWPQRSAEFAEEASEAKGAASETA